MNLYHNCEELPVRPFFKIFETGELKHLLSVPKKRITASEADKLNVTWENIMSEYEELTKDRAYSNSITVSNNRTRKINRLIGIKAAMILLSQHEEEGKEALIYWNIKAKDNSIEELQRIRGIILREQTALAIKIEVDKKDDIEINFFDHWSNLQSGLGYHLDYNVISVAEWVSLLNVLKSRKSGRTN